MTELEIRSRWRGWSSNDAEFQALRPLVTYGGSEPAGRATGWLYLPMEPPDVTIGWPESFTVLGPQLLDQVCADTGLKFTAVCYQAYLDGTGTGWHSDPAWSIQAILSLGVSRTFWIRRPDGTDVRAMSVHHGDLLVMGPGFQQEWEHAILDEDVQGERFSIVFRG